MSFDSDTASVPSSAGSAVCQVQVFGFTPAERTLLASTFALSARRARRFIEWHADSSRDAPDLFLADADDMSAMVDLMTCGPSAVRPAVLVGKDEQGTGWPLIERPMRWTRLFAELDRAADSALVAKLELAHSDRSFVGTVMPPGGKHLDLEFGATNIGVSPEVEDPMFQKTIDLEQLAQYQAGLGPSMGPGVRSINEGLLVVDTDPVRRQLIASRLVPFGLYVDPAESADQAFAMLDHRRYAIAIVATTLPHVDGFTLCKLIKARGVAPTPAVILLTPRNSSIDRMRARLAGSDALLMAPIDEDVLIASVARFLPQTSEDDWVRSQVLVP